MADDASTQDAVIREVVVPFKCGLHARPAARLVQTASGFQGKISVRAGDREVWVWPRWIGNVKQMEC